jgi:hypothetical protein
LFKDHFFLEHRWFALRANEDRIGKIRALSERAGYGGFKVGGAIAAASAVPIKIQYGAVSPEQSHAHSRSL